MNGNGRRLAALAAVLTVLAASGFASAGNSHSTCNAGDGNGAEPYVVLPTPVPYSYDGTPNDCDPGNSGTHNHAGDKPHGL